MIQLRQSTASQEIPLGYFVDSTDGNTEETGLTIANTDIKIWKSGATTLANKNSGGATHISNGVYYAVLDATDTDTVGPMVIFVHVSGALAVRLECHVYEEAIYDAIIGSSATLAGDVASILADTNELQTDDVPGLIGALNDLSAADVNAEVDTALNTAIPGSPTAGSINESVRNAAQALVIRRATCQSGSATSTIVLDASASAVDDFYNDCFVVIVSGTGVGQARHFMDYTGATKSGVVNPPWVTTPDNTSVFQIVAFTQVDAGWWADQITAATDIALTDAAGIRSAVGLASANLDTQLSTIDTVVDAILVDTGTTLDAALAVVDGNVDSILADTADIQPKIGTPAGASVSADIAAVKVDTAAILVDTGTTLDAALAAVDTVVDSILVDTTQIKADLPSRITKNTALANFEFLLVDSADHITGITGEAVTAERSIDGAAFGACANAVSEVGSGIYKIDLDAADLNGNVITLKFTSAGADARLITIVTQP